MPNESIQSFILRTLSRNGASDLSTICEKCYWGLCPSVPLEHAHLFSQIDIKKLQQLYKRTNPIIRDNYGNIIGKLFKEKYDFRLTLTFKSTFFHLKKRRDVDLKPLSDTADIASESKLKSAAFTILSTNGYICMIARCMIIHLPSLSDYLSCLNFNHYS
jgi:hypothetical protein